MDNLHVRLLRRALGQKRKHRSIKTLYGDNTWVEDLDIVNELGGHTGCVNALRSDQCVTLSTQALLTRNSWSTRGNLLASGSDDTYLNIWEYNPTDLARPFTLNTSVSTGHHANIFGVKFMPQSNDRTVVTVAGDSEVRVFDLEYSGAARTTSADASLSASTRSRRFQTFFSNARWLNDSNTNTRVYRSHADRAKRVVTESSPHLFLTCSEDGEVRQWDLRQPSSAYPAPRGGRGYGRLFRGGDVEDSGSVPPPLISYKKYGLDLNSISCSGSQPQYIALGGAHLHCFLHDRRMLGRDLALERGQSVMTRPLHDTNADHAMDEATRCVRRFAPNMKRKMGSHDNGHITACKISDANPNEMIISWSGDYIYSFDLIKGPNVRDAESREDHAYQTTRLKNQSDRKRKRPKPTTSTSNITDISQPPRRLRRVSNGQPEIGETSLRFRHENGNLEDIPIDSVGDSTAAAVQSMRDNLLTEAQKSSERVARSLVQLRKTLFDFSATLQEETGVSMENSQELTPHTETFTNALGQCSSLLPQIDEIIRDWSYPINPDEEEVTLQNTLRKNRQCTWRFVQGSGCLARTLGGRLQSLSADSDPRLGWFDQIRPASREGRNIDRSSRFCYDFLKAILLWLDGGQEAVLAGFKRPVDLRGETLRFPLDASDDLTTFTPKLFDYLTELADSNTPIVNLDANRFEHDENRIVFSSEKHAVQSFTRALAGVKLETRHGTSEFRSVPFGSSSTKRVMDKGAAARFWGVKVGRSLLLSAAEDVAFDFVNRAFGGLRVNIIPDESSPERAQGDSDADEEEQRMEYVDLADTRVLSAAQAQSQAMPLSSDASPTSRTSTVELPHPNLATNDPLSILMEDADENEDEDGIEDDGNEDDLSEDEEDDSEDGDEDDDGGATHPLFRRNVILGRSRERSAVNLDVPYSSHTKVYKGHCNSRTVKDVNYYGLDDEYVVSGSDDGHFFIWDRKTTRILNILEGDGEVVNVVQGHPYEPMIACSGIDSTVKIFGSGGDSREREAAEKGIGIANPGGSVHSSLRYGGHARRARRGAEMEEEEGNNDIALDGLSSRRAMHKCYEITSQNDAERRRGAGDAFVTVSPC